MHITDMLSRAYLPNSNNEPKLPQFEQVNMMSHLPIWKERLQQIQKETEADDVLQTLKRIILSCWPDDKGKCPVLITRTTT